MRIYLNLFGGVAGDMLVAALLDAGAPEDVLTKIIQALPAAEVSASWEKEQRHGIAGLRFAVDIKEASTHRHLPQVLQILAELPLTGRARAWAETAFRELAEAEAKAHGCAAEAVHFHEVGAMDAILDIAAACALLDALHPTEVFCSTIPVGQGPVHCAHGAMPNPAPGTQFLLTGLPTGGFELRGERATPTGVALLRAWQVDFSVRSAGVVMGCGYGLGTHDFEDRANLLRVECETPALDLEWLVELRALVDDQSGEILGHAMETMRSEGAVDVYATPAVGKKNRPAYEVVALVEAARQAEFEQMFFRLLGTLGVRALAMRRNRQLRAQRTEAQSDLCWKTVADSPGHDFADLKPEFESLVAVAAARGKTPRELLHELLQS